MIKKNIQIVFAFILVFSTKVFSQDRFNISEERKISNLTNDFLPRISGYEFKDNKLIVYSLMFVRGIIKSDILLESQPDILLTSDNNGRSLLMSNEINLSNQKITYNQDYKIVLPAKISDKAQFKVSPPKTGLDVSNAKTNLYLTNEMIHSLSFKEKLKELNGNYFPLGKVDNIKQYGVFDFFDNILNFKPLRRPEIKSNENMGGLPSSSQGNQFEEKFQNPDRLSSSSLKLKGDKNYGKLNFEISAQGKVIDQIAFTSAKSPLLPNMTVVDEQEVIKGYAYFFKNTEDKDLEDPNINNITILYYDLATKDRKVVEIPFDKDLKRPFELKKIRFYNNQILIYNNSWLSLSKSIGTFIKIDANGKVEKIVLEDSENRDRYFSTSGKPLMDRKMFATAKEDEGFKVNNYSIKFGSLYEKSINSTSENIEGNFWVIEKDGVVPIKKYLHSSKAKCEFYQIPNSRFFLMIDQDRQEYVVEFINEELKFHPILIPNGYKRPELLSYRNSFVQDENRLYFIYQKNDSFIVVDYVK